MFYRWFFWQYNGDPFRNDKDIVYYSHPTYQIYWEIRNNPFLNFNDIYWG